MNYCRAMHGPLENVGAGESQEILLKRSPLNSPGRQRSLQLNWSLRVSNDFLFTSDPSLKVNPDKVADQISDAILDAIFNTRPGSAWPRDADQHRPGGAGRRDHDQCARGLHQVARDTIKRIGYDNTEYGIDYKGCAVMVCYDSRATTSHKASPRERRPPEHRCRRPGLMFGYACGRNTRADAGADLLRARLVERQAQLRKDGRLPFLRRTPRASHDRYVNGKPHSIDTVVLSTQHSPDQSETATKMNSLVQRGHHRELIKPVLPKEWLKKRAFLINPTGRFVIGGRKAIAG